MLTQTNQPAGNGRRGAAALIRKRHPVADRVIEHLSTLSVSPGDKLPPERDLAKALNITRAVLRTGLGRLEADGLIWRHVGKGTFVGQPSPPSAVDSGLIVADVMNPHDLMEVRLFLEPPAVGLAAIRATPGELAEIAEIYSKTLEANSVLEYEHWDDELHRAIIRSTKNMILMKVAELFSSARDERVWGKLKERSSNPERRAYYSKQHGEIVSALVERRSADAETIMREHIRDVQADLMNAANGRPI